MNVLLKSSSGGLILNRVFHFYNLPRVKSVMFPAKKRWRAPRDNWGLLNERNISELRESTRDGETSLTSSSPPCLKGQKRSGHPTGTVALSREVSTTVTKPQGGNKGTTFLEDLSSYFLLFCLFLPLVKPNCNPQGQGSLGKAVHEGLTTGEE